MEVDSLYIYPIKSMEGIAVKAAELTAKGFKYDRAWMLTDATGRFISQREYPGLALMQIKLNDQDLSVRNGHEEISFNLKTVTGPKLSTSVWKDHFESQEVSSEVSSWFSDMLKSKVKLVTYSESNGRSKHVSSLGRNIEVSYADGYPYLILGTASMDELNARTFIHMSIKRFRPNIVITTQDAHIEDEWKEIQIGDHLIQLVKPCARCDLTTIDPETAEIGQEPLITLSTYRRINRQILFGMNGISHGPGTLNVGDRVEIIS